MTRRTAHLARQITAAIQNAACKNKGQWWSEQEAEHAQATTPTEAAAAAAPALELCRRCTERSLCHQRAELDRYTGLAASAVFINGRQVDITTLMPRPHPIRHDEAG